MSEVASKAKVLDKSLQDVPEARLVELSKIHIEQEEKAESLGQATIELIAQYNDIMTTITDTFIRYDQVLRAAEDLKRAKQDQSEI